MLADWLKRRREAKAEVSREADTLVRFMGDEAYPAARTRARECRVRGDRTGDRQWGRVAVEIASRNGWVIGENTADKYAAGPAPVSEPRAAENRRALRKIAVGLASLASGREDAPTSHNLQVMVRQVAAEAGHHRSIRDAAEEFCRSVQLIVESRAESIASICRGEYPPRIEAAERALDRLKHAMSRTP